MMTACKGKCQLLAIRGTVLFGAYGLLITTLCLADLSTKLVLDMGYIWKLTVTFIFHKSNNKILVAI